MYISDFYGVIAQLGERLVCNQQVAGSTPVGSTTLWGRMYQGGENALQAICGRFDSDRLHLAG